MRKNLLLTALLALVASITMAQTSTWPITLTRADGLPGVEGDEATGFVSELYKFDEPITKLRITVLSNVLFDQQKTDKLGTSGQNGPAFPSIAISELEVRNADNRRISYEPTSNAGSVNSGGSIENLCDGTYSTAFLSTTYMGACPQAFHYIELAFDSPVSEFRLKWYSREGNNIDYMPTHVGLTPGTEYSPFPTQGFKLGEQVKNLEGIGEGGLYVIEGHVPAYTHSFTGTKRSYPGGGFWYSPYGACETASAACIVDLIPTGKPNTYNVYWMNNGHYLANMEKSSWTCNWTDIDVDAAQITFAPCDTVPGDFIITMHDTLIIGHESLGQLSLVEFKPEMMASSKPRTWNFSIYKADMNTEGIKFMLQEKIDEAENYINVCGYNEIEDNGEYEVITAAVNKGKSIIAKSETTVKEIIDSRNEIINAIPAYVSLSIYTYIDSVQNILDAFDSGEMKTSEGPNWVIGTFPNLAVSELFSAVEEAEESIENAKFLTQINNAIENFKKDIDKFWGREVKGFTILPVRMTAENGLPGELNDETGVTWESPIFYLDKEVNSFRYTVFHTTHGNYYGDYEHYSLSEFEVYTPDGKKIELTEDCFQTNSVYDRPGYGISCLCDNKYNSIFHSAWNEGQDPNGYDGSQGHAYIEITLPKAVTAFYIRQYNNKFSGAIKDTPIDFMIGPAGVDVTPTSIGKISAEGDEVVSVTYYNLSGASSETPFTGTINIVKKVYANGAIKTEKQLVK